MLVAVTAIAAVLVVPFFAEDRRLAAAIPQPPPLFAQDLVEIRPGQRACLREIAIDDRAEVAEIKVATYGGPAVPFTFTLEGEDGYRWSARSPRGYGDNETLAFDVTPPPLPVEGRACVRNDGDRRMALYAASDRTRTAAVTSVDGRRQEANIQLAFYEREPVTIAEAWPRIAEDLATFRPIDPWMVWVIGLLVLIGVPAALIAVVGLSARAPD